MSKDRLAELVDAYTVVFDVSLIHLAEHRPTATFASEETFGTLLDLVGDHCLSLRVLWLEVYTPEFSHAFLPEAAHATMPRACVRLLRKVLQLPSSHHLDLDLPFADSDLLVDGLEPSAQLLSLHSGSSCFDLRHSVGFCTVRILPHLGTLRSLVVAASGDALFIADYGEAMNTIELVTVAGRHCKKLSHVWLLWRCRSLGPTRTGSNFLYGLGTSGCGLRRLCRKQCSSAEC